MSLMDRLKKKQKEAMQARNPEELHKVTKEISHELDKQLKINEAILKLNSDSKKWIETFET